MEKTTSFSKILFFLVLISIPAQFCSAEETENKNRNPKKPVNVLFIGNSHIYVNDMPKVLSRMSLSAKSPITIKTFQYTPGGYTLQHHWQDGNSVKLIRRGGWDFIVLQEQSERPYLYPQLMREYVGRFVEEIRKVNAEPVLFMTAAFQNKPEASDKLAYTYGAIAKELDIKVAPVGLAYKASFEKKPNLPLHNLPDVVHANESRTYLTACVFYSTLTRQKPDGLSVGGLNKVKPENEKYLQQIAWETVQSYPQYGKKSADNK
jgi:hypothetical protein